MARLNIDTGTLGNPATGDTLRTAMTKINTNFEELYIGLQQSDDNGGLLTTTVTNGDMRIQPNGTGIVEIDTLKITDDDITSLNTNGTISITGNGTGGVDIEALSFNGTSISSTDSSRINLNENVTVDGDLVVTGSITGTFTVATVDADSTTVSNLEVDNFKASAIVLESEGISSNDNDTTLPTSAAVKDYVDSNSVTASETATFTNKTFDADGTGNSITNIDLANLKSDVLDTDLSSVSGADDTIASAKAIKAYVDAEDANIASDTLTFTNKSGNISQWTNDSNYATQAYVDARDIGDLSVVGSTISAPSNADLTLTTSGTGSIIIDGDATATTFIGALRGATVFQAKATEDISKGEAVYISGLSGNTPEVALARANSASTMPAFGIAESDIANTATGNIVTFGSSTGHDVTDFGETSITFALGDTVYISSAEAGKLTNVAPTGESNLIQNIGKIERVSPTTNITIKVGGAGRTNATPALDDGNIFIGNGSNQSSTVSLATQIKSYTGLTVVGDDSTGTSLNIGETFKVAGATGVTTAVSGDTLTITGPDLSSYLTNSTTTIVGDDSSGTTINSGETFKFAGATGVTTAVSGDTLTITGPDLSSYITASSSDTLTNKTIDANGTGNSISNIEVADFAGSAIINVAETLASNDSDTALVTAGAIIDYVDAQDANIASDTLTFTNKTFDVEGTGNSISNIDVADFKAAAIVTAAEGIGSNNNDTTIPTSAAVKAYADSVGGGGSVGDLTITGSTISSPSNAPLTLDPSGTGKVTAVGGLVVTGGDTETADISSSGQIDAVGFTATGSSTFDGVQITDNTISSAASNANLELDASGTGGIVAQAAMTFNGNAIFNTGVEEAFDTLTGSTGTVTHNCDNGHIFYHTSPSADFTANFTNLGLTAEYGTTLTVIVNQGATARLPTAVQIGGVAQTLNWQGGVAPTGTDNGIDVVSFTVLNDGGTYVVLAQMVDFT